MIPLAIVGGVCVGLLAVWRRRVVIGVLGLFGVSLAWVVLLAVTGIQIAENASLTITLIVAALLAAGNAIVGVVLGCLIALITIVVKRLLSRAASWVAGLKRGAGKSI